jgi:ABC-2 family transporter protein
MRKSNRGPRRQGGRKRAEPRQPGTRAGSPHFPLLPRAGQGQARPAELPSVETDLYRHSAPGAGQKPMPPLARLYGDSTDDWRGYRRAIGRAIVNNGAAVATVLSWEWQAFFRRPLGWLLLLGAALTAGWSFSWLVTLLVRGGGLSLRQAENPIAQFLGPNIFLVSLGTLFVPLLTMNLVAEERRRGTWELLLTSPVSSGQAILGKFLAGWGVLLAALSPWVFYLMVLRLWNGKTQMLWGFIPWFGGLGVDFDLGPAIAGAVGLTMVGGTFIAIGLFCSSLCRRPQVGGAPRPQLPAARASHLGIRSRATDLGRGLFLLGASRAIQPRDDPAARADGASVGLVRVAVDGDLCRAAGG